MAKVAIPIAAPTPLTADELAALNAPALVVTPTDDSTSRAFEAELAAVATDTAVVPVEYDVTLDTRTAEANYASRSNIVEP